MKLIFPPEVLDQHLIALGKTGAGKSSALRHIVEWLLKHNKRVCVIDPKGDWYGLKASADGKGPGFPVVLFGDFKDNIKGDVPLIPSSQLDNPDFDVMPAAKHVAELVVSGNRPCVIGMRGWTQGNMTRFWIEFAPKVFNSESGELYLVNDEIHNFAPKGKVLSLDAGKSLHWTNRLINEGRGIGLMMFAASQRPQKVHNDTLDACETLIAMRVVHPAARKAIKDWLDGAGDKTSAENVYESLAGLERGEAIVWSPEIKFGPQRVRFPMFETYDSFAPPKLQKKVVEKGWATVDLTEVREKLAAVIAKAKAEDPAELKKVNNELRAQVRKLESAKPQTSVETKTEVKTIEKRIMAVQSINRLEGLLEKVLAIPVAVEEIRAAIREGKELNAANMIAVPVSRPVPQPSRTVGPAGGPYAKYIKQSKETVASNGNSEISGPMQKILNELAELEAVGISPADKVQVALFCGYANVKSGGFSEPASKLNAGGLIHYPRSGEMALTDKGRVFTNVSGSPLTTFDLQERILRKLTGPRARLLKELIAIYPESVDKESLATKLGYSNVKSGGFSEPLADLRTLGLIEYPSRGIVSASELLFPPGLG